MTVLTRDIWRVLLANERFLTKTENVYAKRLVKWSSSGSRPFEYSNYLQYILSLRLVKQKQEVNFLVRIFKQAGVELGFFELRFYQNGENADPAPRPKILKKACLASDEEIQKMVKK